MPRKKGPKKPQKMYLLRTLRIQKGIATLKSFADKIAKNMEKTSEKGARAVMSALSRYENGKKPPAPYFEAIKAVLELSPEEIQSINKSFARTGAKKKKTKSRSFKNNSTTSPRKRKPLNDAVPPTSKPGIITPEAAAKFSNAVAALGEISLERAIQLLGDIATK